MKLNELAKLLESKEKEVEHLIRRKLPIHVGRIAKDHYQDNFRQGGYVNQGIKPWPKSKRELSGGESAAANYKTLLSSRNHLFSSIQYLPGDARVKLSNPAPHASIHNNGGTLSPEVTANMRRFAWAKYYEAGGGQKGKDVPEEARKWLGLALTKKKKLTINIPQRQFLGESEELNDKIVEKTEIEIRKILNL